MKTGFVVYDSRNEVRTYRGKDGSWWKDPERAEVYSTEREAAVAKKAAGKTASGYEPVEQARDRNRTGR